MTREEPTQSRVVLTPLEHRRLSRYVKLFLAFSILSGLFGILHNIHARMDPSFDVRPGHVTHVHIGGRDFAVPNEYIRGPRPTEANAKQLYIWLTLPNYEPYLGAYVDDKNPVPIGYRHLMVLIDDTAFTTDLAFRYRAYRNGPNFIKRPEDIAGAYGLHRTSVYYSNARSPVPFITTDLYYTPGLNGQVSNFIACRPDAKPPENPMCDHHFQDGRMLYDVSYSKTHLAEWTQIQARVNRLVNSFSCVPATNTATTNNGAKQCPP